MKISTYYSHLNGLEFLLVHKPKLWDEIKAVIKNVNAESCRTKVSKEIRTKGDLFYSPKEMNKEIAKGFQKKKWKESRTNYWVTDDANLIRKTMLLSASEQKNEINKQGKIPYYSYNQTDFIKDKVAVEVQFGKYSFIAYDLFVKHLAFYMGDKIDIGIEILPMKELQKEMSSGVGYYESGLYDLIREGRGVPAVPLVLVGISP